MPWRHLKNILKILILYLLLYFLLAFHPLVSHTRNPEISWISFLPHPSHPVTGSYLSHSEVFLHFQNKPCPFYLLLFTWPFSAWQIAVFKYHSTLCPTPLCSYQFVKASPPSLNRRTCFLILSLYITLLQHSSLHTLCLPSPLLAFKLLKSRCHVRVILSLNTWLVPGT